MVQDSTVTFGQLSGSAVNAHIVNRHGTLIPGFGPIAKAGC